MAKAKEKAPDLSSEEKIKKAALKLFTQKGYAATRTRDISEEAGINLALLNYYFRSKEKLFQLLMGELLEQFFGGIVEIFNDETTSLDEKMEMFVARYTALLKAQPDIPLFIFHHLRTNPGKLVSRLGMGRLFRSYFFTQLESSMARQRIRRIHPVQFVMNLLSMTVFPFIAAPLLKEVAGVDAKMFDRLLDERRTLIPQWMKMIMESDQEAYSRIVVRKTKSK